MEQDDEMVHDPLAIFFLHAQKLACNGSSTRNDERLETIRSALIRDGYVVLPHVLSSEECNDMLDVLWDYVETITAGRKQPVCRKVSSTWYPPPHTSDEDPWPYTKNSSQPDLFQSSDSGYVLGRLREILAQRVYEPLVFQTRELHSSKEGFTFHRPRKVCSEKSTIVHHHPFYSHQQSSSVSDVSYSSRSTHSDENNYLPAVSPTNVLPIIHSCTSFTSQSPHDQSYCFSTYPGSHVLQRNQRHYELDTEQPLDIVLHKLGFSRKDIYLNAGDVILWRNDIIRSSMANCWPGPDCNTFHALAHVSMVPATREIPYPLQKLKLDGYRMGRTTDHRPHMECWNDFPGELIVSPNCKKTKIRDGHESIALPSEGMGTAKNDKSYTNCSNVMRTNEMIVPMDHFYHRYSPPLLTWRQAELYGLVPYGIQSEQDFETALQRALVRGICFYRPSFPKRTNSGNGTAYFETDGIVHKFPCVSKLLDNSVEVPHTSPRISNPTGSRAIYNPGAAIAILSPDDPPLLGQDKWLGGMPSPDGSYIYGVPGTAPQVLRITVENGMMDFIGPKVKGKFKWLRGLEIPPHMLKNDDTYPKGVCLALPANADSILEINPHTQEVSTFGGPFPGCWKWHGM
jgi:hypothetical protein